MVSSQCTQSTFSGLGGRKRERERWKILLYAWSEVHLSACPVSLSLYGGNLLDL